MKVPITLIELDLVSVEGAHATDIDDRENYMRKHWGLVLVNMKRKFNCKVCDKSFLGLSVRPHFQTKWHLQMIQHWKDNVDPLYENSCEDCPCLTERINRAENRRLENVCRLGLAHRGHYDDGSRFVNHNLGDQLLRPKECIEEY